MKTFMLTINGQLYDLAAEIPDKRFALKKRYDDMTCTVSLPRSCTCKMAARDCEHLLAVKQWQNLQTRIAEAEKLVDDAVQIADRDKTEEAVAAARAAFEALKALDQINSSSDDEEPTTKGEDTASGVDEEVYQFFGKYDVRLNSAPSCRNDTFSVAHFNKGQVYTTIHWPDHSWQCTCADFRFRNRECKHIRGIKKGVGDALGCSRLRATKLTPQKPGG
jgi:hypothetical protein